MRPETSPVRQSASELKACYFSTQIESCRDSLFKEFNTIPSPFKDVLGKHYQRRSSNKSSAENAPWLVADMLGFEPVPRIEELAVAWLLLHFYIIFTDDCIDEKNLDDREILQIAAGLCLQRSLTKFFVLVPSLTESDNEITSYFDEIARAVNEELVGSRSYSAPNPLDLHKKMATAKLWVLLLLHDSDRLSEHTYYIEAIEELTNGFQLRDDLMDWEDDWKQGRNSFVLHQTFSRLAGLGVKKERRKFTVDELLVGMIITSAFADVIDLAEQHLRSSLVKVASANRNISTSYLERCLAETQQIRQCLSNFPSLPETVDINKSFWFREYVESDLVQSALQDLRRKIDIVWADG